MTIINKSIITFLILSFFVLSNCGIWKPVDVKDSPTNALERARKNVNEGRGISVKGLINGRKGETSYQFSTSNPMWRATLETLDFIPFSTVDYSGGLIITDWYSNNVDKNEDIKITVRFLSNEIQSNSLKIIVHKRNCKNNNNCVTEKVTRSKIEEELTRSIMKTAVILEKKNQN